MDESLYTNFPSQVVPDAEKMSPKYGLEVARAIEQEWFNDTYSNRYTDSQHKFHNLRLYARGEQSIQKYKDELSINGDLSYLNLDWKPVPIIPKFVDIVVNGMSERIFNINNRTLHDASISSGLAIMACNKNRYRPTAERKMTSVPLGFKKYDNKGVNSKILN